VTVLAYIQSVQHFHHQNNTINSYFMKTPLQIFIFQSQYIAYVTTEFIMNY